MADKSVLDTFAQFACLTVAGTAAADNTVLARLETGITNTQKVAWQLVRAEYHFDATWLNEALILAAAQDYIFIGLTQSSLTTQAAAPTNPAMVDFVRLCGGYNLTAVGVQQAREMPIVHSFGDHPILMLPQNIYIMLDWATSANLNTDLVAMRIWYKEYELSSADWYDLLQLRLPLGAA